ncbi:MAG: hypothetical protein KIT50_09020 [Bacteroidetes bacterium]|nr:hypothetical protein [Bacteroidota bacterium]
MPLQSVRLQVIAVRTFIILLFAYTLLASGKASQPPDTFDDSSCESPAGNSIFLELGGNGVSLSINYERLMFDNFSLRAGCGAIYGLGTSFPLMANFYFGTKYKLELGAGFVFLPLWKSTASFGKENSLLFSSTVGLRFQPCEGGVTVRVSATPFFDPATQKFRPYAGVSIGTSF